LQFNVTGAVSQQQALGNFGLDSLSWHTGIASFYKTGKNAIKMLLIGTSN